MRLLIAGLLVRVQSGELHRGSDEQLCSRSLLLWPDSCSSDILWASKTDEEDAVGRPPLPLGTHGKVLLIAQPSGQVKARARFRDFDGRVRPVSEVGPSRAAAERALRRRCLSSPVGGGRR